MEEKFCLKWNDFGINSSRAFNLLRKDECLQDVTIIGEDNTQIEAHKLVLSASSEYFKSIFSRNKHSHPLLLLEGVTSTEIKNILDYIYMGEISIFQDDLERFLAVAKRFKLSGLLPEDDGNQANEVTLTTTNQLPTSLKREYEEPNRSIVPIESFGGHSIPRELKLIGRPENEDTMKISMSKIEQESNLDENLNQYLEKTEDGTWRCTLCENFSKKNRRQQVQYHIEGVHIEGLSLPCNLCMKTFRSRQAFRMHKLRYHKN